MKAQRRTAILLACGFVFGAMSHALWQPTPSTAPLAPTNASHIASTQAGDAHDGTERTAYAAGTAPPQDGRAPAAPTLPTANGTTDVNVMDPLIQDAIAGLQAEQEARRNAPIVTRVPIPEDLDEMLALVRSEGAPVPRDILAWLEAERNAPNPDVERIAEEEAYIRETLTRHLRVHTYVDHHAIARANGTGIYRYKVPTEAFLGPESAVLCEPNDAGCTPPLTVSLLCDMSQAITCQTLARAIRLSDKLFLLYPFEISQDMRTTEPDITMIYGSFLGRGGTHVVYFTSKTTIQDNTIRFDFGEHTSQYGPMDFSRPVDIMSAILTSTEETMQAIHRSLGIREDKNGK